MAAAAGTPTVAAASVIPPDIEEFLLGLEDYAPTIPDELAHYVLQRNGFASPDTRITRLISLAVEKFIAEAANEALQLAKMRRRASARGLKAGAARAAEAAPLVLSPEDVSGAFAEMGVPLRRQAFFADGPPGADAKR